MTGLPPRVTSDGETWQITGSGKTLDFHLDFPIGGLTPASYNPRRLSDESFVRLQESLRTWGVVKPVILNADGTLVAGHQRTKALTAIGETTVPAVVLADKVRMQDEVNFNLLHNRVETEASDVRVPFGEPGTWALIQPDDIEVRTRSAAAFRAAIGQMTAGHGPWGSCVADDQGRVFLNSEYAAVCGDARLPLLTYFIDSQSAAQMFADLTGEYGVYDWSKIADHVAPVYNQHYAQLHRLVERKQETNNGRYKAGEIITRSTTWEKKILPWLTKEQRVVDFGAGYGDYARHLRGEGYQVWDYEPFRCAEGTYQLDVRAVVKMIRNLERSLAADGLFDVVMLDSVINSITTNEYQEAVITMCNALCRRDGVFVTGTRTLHSKLKTEQTPRSATRSGNTSSGLGYLDENLVEFKFTKGKWGAQRYHTPDTLRAVLERYFDDVEIDGGNDGQMYAVCHHPRPLTAEQIERMARIEFNMPYPNDFRHNRHEQIVATLTRLAGERDAARPEGTKVGGVTPEQAAEYGLPNPQSATLDV